MRVSPNTSARHLPKQWRVIAVAFIVALGTLSPFMPGVTPAFALAPTLSSSTPADNATGISICTDITLQFNQSISRGTGDISLKSTTGVVAFDAVTELDVAVASRIVA